MALSRLATVCLTLWAATLVSLSAEDWSSPLDHRRHHPGATSSRRGSRYSSRRLRRDNRPNVIFIITDDQDIELGSMNYMPKTGRALRDAGATFTNAFVTTPMCCPSRSSMLTGLYVHNHFTYTNNDNCSSPQWRQTHEPRTFGAYLHAHGYRTGFFGKYLNEYSGSYVPPGWTEWHGLIRNTRFYNYSVNHNGQRIKHNDNYHLDYLTDLIANNSVRFLRQSKRDYPHHPVAMVLSMPAPHGPEDSAPQYQHLFFDVKTHRTPSWNFAPNPDKQWLLQYTSKMTPMQIAFTDLLHTKRLQTLQSVDDAVDLVRQELENIGELDNTYIIYTSDHGYHLGQYGLVKGKAMPYEFDIRVPFVIRGPGIPAGIRMPNIVLNLDIAPTLLDIAGVPIPDHMDGNSVMKLFDGPYDGTVRRRRVWRDTFLVERGKLTMKKLKVQEKIEARLNRLVMTKTQRLEEACLKLQYQSPCKPGQQWECRVNDDGKLRVYKCRDENTTSTDGSPSGQQICHCGTSRLQRDRPMRPNERQRQLDFLQHHVNKPDTMSEPVFIPERYKRSADQPVHGSMNVSQQFPVDIAVNLSRSADDHHEELDELAYDDDEYFETMHDDDEFPLSTEWTPVEGDGLAIPCRLTANDTVECERYVYTHVEDWKEQRNKVERVLHAYRRRIAQLKQIRRHLAEYRPAVPRVTDDELTSVGNDSSSTSVITHDFLDQADDYTDNDDVTNDDDDDDVDGDMPVSVGDFENDDECVCEDVDDSQSRLFENIARRAAHQELREERRRRKLLQRKSRRMTKRRNRRLDKRPSITTSSFDCDFNGGPCDHDMQSADIVSHGSRNPWDGVDLSRFSSRRDPACNVEGLECSRMDNEHWKVPPYWTHGPFCMCPNAQNNTYWCLRTVNDTHNFLYCEFITGFISYYDMTQDPYQLRNAVHDLSFGVLHQLHDTLEVMKGCKGSRHCNLRYRSPEERASLRQQRRDSGHVGTDEQPTSSRFEYPTAHRHHRS